MKTTKSGKHMTKSYVDGYRWAKETQVDKSLGEMWIQNKNSEVITINISEIGFTMDVTRGSVYFQLYIKLLSSKWNTTGLCYYVPTSVDNLIKNDYTIYDTAMPILGQTGTYVSALNKLKNCSL